MLVAERSETLVVQFQHNCRAMSSAAARQWRLSPWLSVSGSTSS